MEKENGLMTVVIMAEVWRRWGKGCYGVYPYG